MWIGIWEKIKAIKELTYTTKWLCQGFGVMYIEFIMICILIPKNDINIYHKKQCSDQINTSLTESFMNIEFQTCGIFEGLSHPKEVK